MTERRGGGCCCEEAVGTGGLTSVVAQRPVAMDPRYRCRESRASRESSWPILVLTTASGDVDEHADGADEKAEGATKYPLAGVMATKPAIQPEAAPRIVGLP